MRAVAISLCNLSVLKSCRKDMIKMNVIEVLTQLLGSGITDTVYLCTLALSNLTAAPDLRQIVANKGAITVLCTLLSSPHAPTCAVASKSLANFACDGACRAKVIAANAVPPMLNLFANADEAVRSDSLGAIINLLSFPDTYHHVVECDLITHLKDIMHHTMHLDAIAMALFNVTTYPDMHPMLIEQGGAELLVSLLLNPNLSHLVEQNLASLANIAKTKGVTPALIKAGIVQALWTPIANAIPSGETTAVLPTATATKLAHILMDLSTTEDACKPLVAEGGVLSLVQLARQDDDVTKLAVAAVFYNLSLKKVGIILHDPLTPPTSNPLPLPPLTPSPSPPLLRSSPTTASSTPSSNSPTPPSTSAWSGAPLHSPTSPRTLAVAPCSASRSARSRRVWRR